MLSAGEQKTISLEIPVSELRYWNEETQRWEDDLCDIEILVGSSVNDIKLNKKVSLK